MKNIGKTVRLAICAMALAGLALGPSAAQAEVLSRTQTADVTIPSAGNATPYPSELLVEEADGNILDINVQITFSHTFPDDVDIALLSPDGDSELLMSDVCGSGDLNGALLEFNDEAPAPLSDAGPCAEGSFQPSNVGAGDTFEAPGPGAVSTASLAAFDSEDPNGVWKLFAVDDLGGFEGAITSWSVVITTETAEVIIPATGTSGLANPYPSTKTFDVPAGTVIDDLNVKTPDFNHLHPDDVDMLLAGPRGGATAVLMSDACGSTDIHDYAWTWDDEAANPMSDDVITGCNPFVIKPTDFEPGDDFPAPAPAGPHGTSLATFDGLEGGAFSLFVNDDAGADTGFMTSWTIEFTTRDAADTGFSATSAQANEGTTALLEVKRSGPPSLGPATLAVSVTPGSASADDFSAPTTLVFARGEGTKEVAVPIVADKAAEGAETLEVTLSSPRDDARLTGDKTATVVINPSAAVVEPNTPPSNAFKFGKLKRNAKKGTANLQIGVPGPGQIVLSGKKVKRVKKAATKAGNVGLPIKPKGKVLDVLEEKGSAKLGVKITFTPTGGSPLTLPKRLKLILND